MAEEGRGKENPYRSPGGPSRQRARSGERERRNRRIRFPGFWDDEPFLVVERGASFPDRCVVCFQPADPKPLICRIRRSIPPIVFILLLVIIGPLFLIVVAACLPSAQIKPGLCGWHRGKELWGRRITGGLVVLSVLSILVFLFVLVGMQQDTPAWTLLFVLLGLFLFFVAIVHGEIRTKPLKAEKIDEQFVWLTGAHPSFLKEYALVPTIEEA